MFRRYADNQFPVPNGSNLFVIPGGLDWLRKLFSCVLRLSLENMESASTALNAVIQAAFVKAKKNGAPNKIHLGPLARFECIFPARPAPALAALATSPYLNVYLGIGEKFATQYHLHEFFTGMLIFQSEVEFAAFIKNGYTVVVSVGDPNKIVAAASFITENDGLFVDAIAVSHEKHKRALRQSMAMTQRLSSVPDVCAALVKGNFQGLGLGSFLICLLSRIATITCSSKTDSVYLKAHQSSFNYYTHRGFVKATSMGAIVEKALPDLQRCVNKETIMMVRHCGRSDVSAAANAMVSLSSTSPEQPQEPATNSSLASNAPPASTKTSDNVGVGDDEDSVLAPQEDTRSVPTPNVGTDEDAATAKKTAKPRRKKRKRKALALPITRKTRSGDKKDRKFLGAVKQVGQLKNKGKRRHIAEDSEEESHMEDENEEEESEEDADEWNEKGRDKEDRDQKESEEDGASKKDSGEEESEEELVIASKKESEEDESDEELVIAKQHPPVPTAKRLAPNKFNVLQAVDSETDDDRESDHETPSPWRGPRKETLDNDWWQSANPAYAQYKASIPVTSHKRSQKELCAEYDAPQPRALGRLKLLEMARKYQVNTQDHQTGFEDERRQCNVVFTDQDYLDLAAVADLHRPIEIHHEKYKEKVGNVLVKVSSYRVRKRQTLAILLSDETARHSMKREVREILVSVTWLMTTTRPDVTEWIDETLHGTKVYSVAGVNAVADEYSLSFSGKAGRAQQFLSPPQGHVATTFLPVAPPTIPWCRPKKKGKAPSEATRQSERNALGPGVYYDKTGRATSALLTRMKVEARAVSVPYMAPPPKDDTQIVKLKWVKSPGATQNTQGLWHGLYATQLGCAKTALVLQECGLLTDWVEATFAAPFRSECKTVACGTFGARKTNKYLFIPAGDVHDLGTDPPPSAELLPDYITKYQQGKLDTCLRDSLASALTAVGFGAEAEMIASKEELVGTTVDLVTRIIALVRRQFSKAQLVMKKICNHSSLVESIAQLDSAWPIVLLLQTSDGSHASHAITTWKGMIFDSNCKHPLRWSQSSLDWCSGPESTCIGFSRAYQIAPQEYVVAPIIRNQEAQEALAVGSWLKRTNGTTGWIWRFPCTKRNTFLVRYPSGAIESMSEKEVASRLVTRLEVGAVTF